MPSSAWRLGPTSSPAGAPCECVGSPGSPTACSVVSDDTEISASFLPHRVPRVSPSGTVPWANRETPPGSRRSRTGIRDPVCPADGMSAYSEESRVGLERGGGLDDSNRLPDPDATRPDKGGDMLGTRSPGVALDRCHPQRQGRFHRARLPSEVGGSIERRLAEGGLSWQLEGTARARAVRPHEAGAPHLLFSAPTDHLAGSTVTMTRL